MAPGTAGYSGIQPLRIPAEQSCQPRRRVGKRTLAASALLGSAILLILVTSAGMMLGAWRLTVVDTGSMRPTLNPGDVAVLVAEPTLNLKLGQIVAFHPPGEPRLTVIHRVFSIRRGHGAVVIRTKGDANNTPDPWHARIADDTVWHETLTARKVGYLAAWSQQRAVRFGVLLVIVILAVSTALGSVWRRVTPVER